MKLLKLFLLAGVVLGAVGCGAPAQTEEEAKKDEIIQQEAPELKEGN